MNCLPLVPYLILLLDSVLASLLAPVNFSINSFNFHHVLRWDPGPGTPPGTLYKIIKRVNTSKQIKCTKRTSVKIRLPRYDVKYALTVQAFYNQSESSESSKLYFTPARDTTIGPPEVSLTGGGTYILINISLPVAQEIMSQGVINPTFKISWRKPNTAAVSIVTKDSLFNLTKLQIGMEYCVQVRPMITGNELTTPSDWNCAFTSIVEPRESVVGAVAASLILAIGVLMSSLFCLHYTGFLCKLNILPRVLRDAVHLGHTLTPERTIPDNISISAGVEKQRNLNRTPQPATRDSNSEEEEEVEEEEEEHVYMDRDVELSSGESPCKSSVDVLGNSKVAASGASGSLTVETEVLDTEFEVEVTHGCLDRNEDKAEGVKVSVTPEVSLTPEVHVTVEEDEDQEIVYESSGNINLFSVTLAALAVCEEGEEAEENTRDSLADFFSDVEPLLPADSKRTFSHRDPQTESDGQTTVALMLQTQDFAATGSEGRHAHILSCDGEHEETQEEDEDEEEEFSGYMRHT